MNYEDMNYNHSDEYPFHMSPNTMMDSDAMFGDDTSIPGQEQKDSSFLHDPSFSSTGYTHLRPLNVTSNLSPESSTQDSMSNSSNEQDPIKEEEQDVLGDDMYTDRGETVWTNMSSNLDTIEAQNEMMEGAFDFNSASSPGLQASSISPFISRGIAMPASTTSPMSAVSPFQFDDNTAPVNSFVSSPAGNGWQMDRSGSSSQQSQESMFGYQVHHPLPFQMTQPMAMRGMDTRMPMNLYVYVPRPNSRVENQMHIKVALSPFPEGITKLHLQPYTIGRPKFLEKSPHRPSKDTLELHAAVFCASALEDEQISKKALATAAKVLLADKETVARKLNSNKQAPMSDDENPLKGAEVWVCDNCIGRERKRNDRRKTKNTDDEAAWKALEAQRILVFNTAEMQHWEPYVPPVVADPDPIWPPPAPPTQSAMQVEIPMRFTCYCRHVHEKKGFRVVFTIKDFRGEVLAQTISRPVNVTDDHKTTKEEPDIIQRYSPPQVCFNQQQNQPELGRNAHSAIDLHGLREAFSRSEKNGQPRPFANPQAFSQPVSTSQTPRNLSRQSSPNTNGPAKKKRKSSGNAAKLPESLQMTKLQNDTSNSQVGIGARMSYPSSPSTLTSPLQMINQGMNLQHPPVSFPSHEPNGFGFFHRSSASRSYEHSPEAMAPYSAASSAPQSRAPSPHITDTSLATFGGMNVSHPVWSNAFNHIGPMMQSPLASPSASNPSPEITLILPKEGPKAGGYEVSIVGSGFYNGIYVRFGDAMATSIKFWNQGVIWCRVPPAKTAGKVRVTLHSSASGDIPFVQANPKAAKFEYIDDDEIELMRRALILLGNKETGGFIEPGEVARRIVNGQGDTSNAWTNNSQQNGFRRAYGVNQPMMDKSESEDSVLKLLDLVDNSNTTYPARYGLKNSNGQTILHLAASLGFNRLVAALLARGADPNAEDKNGMSPMHMAALNERPSIVRRLKTAGGDPFSRSHAGWTPADMATFHDTNFAIRSITSPRSVSVGARPRSSRSAISLPSLRSPHHRFPSRDYFPDVDSNDETSEDSSDDDLTMYPTAGARAVQQRAASRRNSAAENLEPLAPAILDQAHHTFLPIAAVAAAWRDQMAAQWQQFQQTVISLGLPPLQLSDYQINTNEMMRKFEALRGSRPAPSYTKEQLQSDSHSPPAYNDIYPATGSTQREIKTESAAHAAVDAIADVKCATLYDTVNEVASSSTTTKALISENDQMLLKRRKDVKRLRSDSKLFLFWIPLLILVLGMMIKDRLPELVEIASKITGNTGTSNQQQQMLPAA